MEKEKTKNWLDFNLNEALKESMDEIKSEAESTVKTKKGRRKRKVKKKKMGLNDILGHVLPSDSK